MVIYTEEISSTARSNQRTREKKHSAKHLTTFLALSESHHLIVNALNVKGLVKCWIKVEICEDADGIFHFKM